MNSINFHSLEALAPFDTEIAKLVNMNIKQYEQLKQNGDPYSDQQQKQSSRRKPGLSIF